MKVKVLFAALAMGASAAASADYLCSYGAYIDSGNRYNSSGARLTSVAAIIQQERADVHKFGQNGEYDCHFHSPSNRQKIAGMLQRGSITPSAKQKVLKTDGYITVDIYSSHIVVR